jgi:predicted nucleic acid-binding Zn ribbon protein
MPEFRDLGPAVRRVMRRIGAPEAGTLERLEAGWADALDLAADHARLVRFAEGELVVEVDHAVWATRVRMARPRLEALAGEALRVEVRVRR